MPLVRENPAARMGARTGPLNASSSAADGSDTAPNSAPNQAEILRNPGGAVAAMRRELNLEFLHECAGGVQIHAGLVQTFAEIGDPAGVCYALKRLFAHVKAAHPVYQELRDEAASNNGASL